MELARDREGLKASSVWSYEAIDIAMKLAVEMAKTTMMSPSQTWHYVRLFLTTLNASYHLYQATGYASMERLIKMAASPPIRNPFAEGADAALAGRGEIDNPYPIPSDEHLVWNEGYNSTKEQENK